jgi:NAD(P)-dependent dehydrogenase (short-subunit alcohol dehydrogenase family)
MVVLLTFHALDASVSPQIRLRFQPIYHQVALVTGAGSGIGRALVRQFVTEGAAVVAVDIVEEALHKVVAELQAQGGRATGCVANIASVIAFLASDDASNVNGAILTADNGWFAG